MEKKTIEKMIAGWLPLAVLFGILLVPVLGGNIGTAQGAENWRDNPCVISNIAVLENRIHVRCTTAEPNIPALSTIVYFYAASTANSPNANRMLAILNTAYVMGQAVSILYDSTSGNNPTGCATNNCRKLLAVTLP